MSKELLKEQLTRMHDNRSSKGVTSPKLNRLRALLWIISNDRFDATGWQIEHSSQQGAITIKKNTNAGMALVNISAPRLLINAAMRVEIVVKLRNNPRIGISIDVQDAWDLGIPAMDYAFDLIRHIND